ncbi:hypothetical protein [Streptomyces sp. SCUT-3]|uniref:hypothetical protein n=1 Tax=Streptomyces sp. SCUT-3 TaxID=2684469 RepID=UPI001C7166BC|nr:hypothetical protein [Streptomyces sp. SCUT-3]
MGDWSPGDVDDEALAALVGARAFAAARRSFDRGYTAHVHRPGDGEPAARVELPTCTVRFPVPESCGTRSSTPPPRCAVR